MKIFSKIERSRNLQLETQMFAERESKRTSINALR